MRNRPTKTVLDHFGFDKEFFAYTESYQFKKKKRQKNKNFLNSIILLFKFANQKEQF